MTVLLNSFIGIVGTGTVWISGGTLAMTNNDVFLPYASVGRLTLSNGTLLAGTLTMSTNFPGHGTLTILGGTASISSNLIVGDCLSNGVGQITINGGTFAVTNAAHTALLDLR